MERKKILVVDDEPDMVAYLATLLEDQGYRTIQARSAGEAMQRVGETRPDLICMDIKMPGQSGISLYRRIMMDHKHRGIPTIFISAYGTPRDFFGEGFRKIITEDEVPEPAAYIEKPIQAPELLEAIRKAIGRERVCDKRELIT